MLSAVDDSYTATSCSPSCTQETGSGAASDYQFADGRFSVVWDPRIVPPQMMLIAEVGGSERAYRLNGPFVIDFEYDEEDGLYFASHRALPVSGIGDNLQEALNSFLDMFDVQYQALVENRDDDPLAPDAEEAASVFRHYVSEVIHY